MQDDNLNENKRNFWVFADVYHRAIGEAVKNRLDMTDESSEA